MSDATMTDLAHLVEVATEVQLKDRLVKVSKVKVKNIPTIMATVSPILGLLRAYQKEGRSADVFQLVTEYYAPMLKLSRELCDLTEAELDELELDDLLLLLEAIFALNMDFFIRRVLPLLSEEMVKLAAVLKPLKPMLGGKKLSSV